MSRTLIISQEVEIRIDWKKLVHDLKKEFGIDISEESVESFCCENERKYLNVIEFEQDIEETSINDLTLEEEMIQL